jgi:hypothetical protein
VTGPDRNGRGSEIESERTAMFKSKRASIVVGIINVIGLGVILPSCVTQHFKIGGLIAILLLIVYGISLLFSDAVPAMRRLSSAYLAFVGGMYFLAGAFGLDGNGHDIVSDSFWDMLLNPNFLRQLIHTERLVDRMQISRDGLIKCLQQCPGG